MIVVDATVVAGFLFPADQFHTQADAVRAKDPGWHCPELVFPEVRSVATEHCRKGETLDATIAQCNLAAAAVAAYRMHSHSVLHAAAEGGVWVYDAEYMALARQLQVKLITTDERILAQFPAVALSPADFLNC